MNIKTIISHDQPRFFLAFALIFVAAAVRVWPLQALGAADAWLTFYPAVVLAAIYGGVAAGLLATTLACLVVAFLWPLLVGQSLINSPAGFLGMAVFGVSCLAISLLIEAMRRAKARACEAKEQAELAVSEKARSERFIKSLVNAVPNMIGYWHSDLVFGFANAAYLNWHGKQPESLVGHSVRELMGAQLFELNEPHIRRALAGEAQHFQRTLTKVDGSIGHILANYIPDVDEDGRVRGVFVHASDVTELKLAHAELELSASVFENTIEGIAVTDVHGRFVSVNPAFTAITGYTATEAIGQTPRILKSNRHDQAFYASMWRDLATRGQWKGDIWNRRKNGEVYLERITITMIRGATGDSVRYVSVFSDITDLWHKDEYLKHLAFHDALTDLPNRQLLMELLHHQIAIEKRDQSGLALMFLDLDGFKLVNDSFGHDVGDSLLKVVAQRLLALVRESDTVARLGGDEFVVKLDNPASEEEITQIAIRAIAAINEPVEFRGESARVGVSIGIAVFPSDGNTPDALIKSADAALYAAKAAGKNTFRFAGSGRTER